MLEEENCFIGALPLSRERQFHKASSIACGGGSCGWLVYLVKQEDKSCDVYCSKSCDVYCSVLSAFRAVASVEIISFYSFALSSF